MFGRRMVTILDVQHGLLERVDLSRFSSEYPGLDIRPFVDKKTGKEYLFAFTPDLPIMDRVDLQDKYWQSLAKWLLAAPSPSSRFPTVLVIIISAVVGLAIGLAF